MLKFGNLSVKVSPRSNGMYVVTSNKIFPESPALGGSKARMVERFKKAPTGCVKSTAVPGDLRTGPRRALVYRIKFD
jgi:hypothetical protein